MQKIIFISILFVSLFMTGCFQTTPQYDGTLKEEAKKSKHCSKKVILKESVKEKRFVTYTDKQDFPVTVRKISDNTKSEMK